MKLITEKHIWNVTIHQNRSDLPWLVLIHGFMGSGEVFSPLLPRMSQFSNPVTLDLPGHGASSLETDPGMYSEEALVNDLHSVLTRLKLSPVTLCGYSLGGRLLLQYAVVFDSSFDRLILESSTPGIEDPEGRAVRTVEDEKRASTLLSNYSRFLEEWHKMPLFCRVSGDPNHWELYKSVMEKQFPASLAAMLRGFGPGRMTDVWSRLKYLKKPVCLVTGERDAKFVSINRRMNDLLPNAELAVIPGASHRPHLDRSDIYIEQIKTFTNPLRHDLE